MGEPWKMHLVIDPQPQGYSSQCELTGRWLDNQFQNMLVPRIEDLASECPLQPGQQFGFQRENRNPRLQELPLLNCVVQSQVVSVEVDLVSLHGPYPSSGPGGFSPCLAWCWEVTLEILYVRDGEGE